MKIKLLCGVPVNKQHGMTKGRICDVTLEVIPTAHGFQQPRWYVMSDIGEGEEVGILPHEAEVVEEER